VTEFIQPGVFVEEVSFRGKAIEGVSTSTAGFVGVADAGPTHKPVLVTGIAEFDRTFGETCALRHAAAAFFEHGGRRLFVVRAADPARIQDGLRALERVGEIALVAAPGAPLAKELVEHAERMHYRFALLDGPGPDIDSSRAALYSGDGLEAPASAFAAAVYARPDPAEQRAEDDGDSRLNVVRLLDDGTVRISGGRTLSSDPEWKYVNVRRYFIYLEHSIDRGTQWAVFEPNGEALWANVRRTITDFLLDEWQQGALTGRKAEEAFFVKCDRSTMTQDDLDDGRLVCVIGVAPLRPAEFVIIQIGRWTADHRCP
jgi:phage tail sheath protein FI